MQCYKCDLCGSVYEGDGLSHGYMYRFPDDKAIPDEDKYTIKIQAHGPGDICKECFLEWLEWARSCIDVDKEKADKYLGKLDK